MKLLPWLAFLIFLSTLAAVTLIIVTHGSIPVGVI